MKKFIHCLSIAVANNLPNNDTGTDFISMCRELLYRLVEVLAYAVLLIGAIMLPIGIICLFPPSSSWYEPFYATVFLLTCWVIEIWLYFVISDAIDICNKSQ